MSISSWLSWTFSCSDALRGQRRSPTSRRKKARLFLEHLEGRALLSGYTAASVSALIADINLSNTAGGSNTISLTAPTTSPYILTAVNNSINGLPVIAANDKLTIVGNGDTIERSTAAGTPDFRLLEVVSGGSLTLENLTLQGGHVASSTYEVGGGAIWSQGGTLVLKGVTVQGNTCFDDYPGSGLANPGGGGGIFSVGGSVTLEGGTIVQNNVASFYSGGGLLSIGTTVTVTNATVDNNGAGRYGGGLYVSGGTLTVTNATVDNNVAGEHSGGWGGGLYVYSSTVTLANDTVESNSAKLGGGGIWVNSGTVTLANDTVESNTASGTAGYGGGIYIVSGATVYLDSFTVANTINNTDNSGLNGSTANIDGTYILQNP